MLIRSIIHPDGWKFVGIFAFVTLILSIFSGFLGYVGVALTAWCVYFFRNPERVTPSQKGLIISPADGKVVGVKEVVPPKEFDMGTEPMLRISIFLNVFDVHINRVPVDGVIKKIIYHPGRFFNASLDKASEHNERQSLIITTEDGTDIACVQIAGLIARRIRCDIAEGESTKAGFRYGLIRFGSRADVYLPRHVAPLVIEGQRMVAGETVLADLHGKGPARTGEYR